MDLKQSPRNRLMPGRGVWRGLDQWESWGWDREELDDMRSCRKLLRRIRSGRIFYYVNPRMFKIVSEGESTVREKEQSHMEGE